MRWQVHGTDSASGKRITLALQDDHATGAVHAAMAKGILVTHVTRGPRFRILSITVCVLCTIIIVLSAAGALFHWRETEAREQLAAALAEEARLADALTETGGIVTTLQRRTAALELAQGGAARQLVDQLEAARHQAAVVEKQLAAAQAHAAELEKRGAATGKLQTELAAAQTRAALLEAQLQSQRLRIQELDGAQGAAASLEKTNHELASQIDILQTQLLEQTAKSISVPVAQVIEPAAPAPQRLRWALRTSYDAASDFIALHFDKNATSTALGHEGAVITTGLWSANAASVRLAHDPEKNHLYAATLTLSLASDAPKEKLAENQRLLADFLHQFAPSFKEAGPWIADTLRQLAGKDTRERTLRIGDDYKLTVWNNRLGFYSWKIESPRADFDE